MKTLYIVRHAKSSWDYPGLLDFDRPLKEKGIKRTMKICAYLKEKGEKPTLIKTSGAERALATANMFQSELNNDFGKIVVEDSFYPGSVDVFLDHIICTNDDTERLMIIGHNPALTDLVNELLPDFTLDWLPTSALVKIDCDIKSWQMFRALNCSLNSYITPKLIKK